jgi:hypothetical protein
MTEDFDDIWSDIQKRLMAGTLVRYWSTEKGYIGGAFCVDNVDSAGVIIRSGEMRHEKRVSKSAFRQLFAIWDTYNRGLIGPTEFGTPSENTIFILSILQWRGEAQISQAPTERISSVLMPPQSETVLATGLTGHHDYGKWVLHEATEGRATFHGLSLEIDYGTLQPAPIDATVGDIAVDIEAGAARQVRGAVLDLICHAYPKKLLVLLPNQITSRGIIAEQCRSIFRRFCSESSFRVLILKGNGRNPQLIEDAAIMAAALADLRSG